MSVAEPQAGTPENPVIPAKPYAATVKQSLIGEDTHVMYESDDGKERVIAIRDSFYHRRLAKKDSGYKLVKGKALQDYLDGVAEAHARAALDAEEV